MENKMKKERKCYQCLYYDAYYIKRFTRFERMCHGFCRKKGVNVGNRESCCEGAPNYESYNAVKKAAIDKIVDMESALNQIKQILKEAADEAEIKEY